MNDFETHPIGTRADIDLANDTIAAYREQVRKLLEDNKQAFIGGFEAGLADAESGTFLDMEYKAEVIEGAWKEWNE